MRISHPSIAFAGTPEFAVPALARLVAGGHRPLAVYTQPDRPAGRGRSLQASPVKRLAMEHGLELRQPASFRAVEDRQALAALAPDLLIVVAYGLILPQAVLDIPRYGCWNIHASLLPRWRGAAPIQRAIEAGDRQSGVCIMQMEAGLDTGPVYYCLDTPIAPDETGGSLHDRLAVLGADALLECLGLAERGELPEPTPQNDADAVYAPKLTKDEALLNWRRPAIELERQVRAFNPWPICWTTLKQKRLRVWAAQARSSSHDQAPGTIVASNANGIEVATAAGSLLLREVQSEGGRRMSAADFLNATRLETGQALGTA